MEIQNIRIETGKDTSWDVDRILIEPILKVRELKPVIFMLKHFPASIAPLVSV